MSFITLIIKNLIRQPVRTGLTVLGISIGITTVVALGVITGGLKSTTGDIIKSGGADFMVAQKGASDLSFSTVTEQDADALAKAPGVERASGVVLHITQAGSNVYFMVLGTHPADLSRNPPPLREGALFGTDATDEILLGDAAARDLKATLGSTVTIDRTAFKVAGIYHTGSKWEDAGGYAPLATVQKMASKPNVVSVVFVTVQPDRVPKVVATEIEEQFQNLVTISEVSEVGKVDQGIRLIDAANIAISILAVGIGAIGVMNTMVMSVFERTRQIGILRAVGWSGFRILRMILGESLVLCAIAAVTGALLGVLASRAVLLNPTVRSLLELQYTTDIFVRALVVAVAVALVGALYPAYRAIRLTPMEALRYE